MKKKASVTVLMSTYNGEKFLRKQIESILSQKNVNVQLIVRDDGSEDGTVDILKKYQSRGLLKWYSDSNLKTARSFLDLVQKSPDDTYYAFSDQDDYWFDQKLEAAVSRLEKTDNSPALYTGNFILTDEKLHKLNYKIKHITTTTLANAIVYSCCTGCTMVFNRQLRDLIKNHTIPKILYMHDDWIHKVCLAVGGKVIYDDRPMMFYRQHEDNVDGGIHSFRSKIKRLKTDKKLMSTQLEEIYDIYNGEIPTQNKKIIKKALNFGKGNLVKRLMLAYSSQYKIRCNAKLNNEFRLMLFLNQW